MPFTKARWESYSPHTDGTEYVVASTANLMSGTAANAKIAAGDYGLSIGASQTVVMAFPMPAILRTGEPHLESITPYEQYNNPTGAQTIPGVQAGTTETVLTGVKLVSVDLIYLISGAAATTNTVGIFVKEDANNAAAAITTLVAQGANGLATATQTDRYVTNVPISTADQAFVVTPDSVITVEWDIDTTTGGAADIFGVVFNFDFNYT